LKAVIYTRVSSEDQVDNTSLESQEKLCREYCKRMGFEIARVFSDRGESAKTSDRPQFLEMIRYATTEPGIVAAIVYKLDRFARNQFDTAIFIRALAVKGVALRSATEQIADGMEGKIMRGVLSLLAEIDNDIRADRSKASMRSLIEKGYWVHQAPLGYRTARDSAGNPILSPDPETGPTIRAAFEAIAAGTDGTRTVTDRLIALGIKTRKGTRLSISALHKLLRTEIYCGRISGKLTGGRTIKAAFVPLITEDLFDRVQAVLSGRATIQKPRERTREDLPLKGLVKCGHCGAPLTASISRGTGGRYAYYHCWAQGCRKTRVRTTSLHEAYATFLEGITVQSNRVFALFREIVMDVWAKRQDAARSELACAKTNLDHLTKQQDRLLEKLLSGVIDDATYKTKADQLKVEIAIAKSAAIDRDMEEIDMAALVDFADHLLSNARRIWERLDAKSKGQFQQALFPQGLEYTKETGLRTKGSSRILGLIPLSDANGSKLATPTRFELVLPG
jgi:site-specific DNA recombinase